MLCQLGFLRGRALGNGLPGVRGCPVAHNVVLPFLVSIKLSLGDVVPQSSFVGLVGFQMGDGIGIARNRRILRGVLGFDIGNGLLVGGVVTFQSRNAGFMICQLGGMGCQLCGVLGNELSVCQLCGLGAVDFLGQGRIGCIGLGVQTIQTALGGGGALFQCIQSAVLLNVFLLNMRDCIPVGFNLSFVLGQIRTKGRDIGSVALDGRVIVRDFLMLGGQPRFMVFQLFGMVGQLVRVHGNLRRVVLNVLDVLGNIGGVLGDTGIMALELGIDTVQPGILLGVLCLKGGNVIIIAGNLPLKFLVLGVKVGNFGGVLGGRGLKRIDFRFSSSDTLGQRIHAGLVLGHRVFHLRVVLGELVDFLPEIGIVRCKAGDLRGKVFHLVFVLLHLRIVCASLGPIPGVGNVNAGANVALAGVALAIVGDNGQALVRAVIVPFNGVCENGNVPTAHILGRGTRPTGNRGPGRHRGTRATRPTRAGVSGRERRGLDGIATIILATHVENSFQYLIIRCPYSGSVISVPVSKVSQFQLAGIYAAKWPSGVRPNQTKRTISHTMAGRFLSAHSMNFSFSKSPLVRRSLIHFWAVFRSDRAALSAATLPPCASCPFARPSQSRVML